MKKLTGILMMAFLLFSACQKEEGGTPPPPFTYNNTLTWDSKSYELRTGGSNELTYELNDPSTGGYKVYFYITKGSERFIFSVSLGEDLMNKDYLFAAETQSSRYWQVSFTANTQAFQDNYLASSDNTMEMSAGKINMSYDGGDKFTIRTEIKFKDGKRLSFNYQGDLTLSQPQ